MRNGPDATRGFREKFCPGKVGKGKTTRPSDSAERDTGTPTSRVDASGITGSVIEPHSVDARVRACRLAYYRGLQS